MLATEIDHMVRPGRSSYRAESCGDVVRIATRSVSSGSPLSLKASAFQRLTVSGWSMSRSGPRASLWVSLKVHLAGNVAPGAKTVLV